MKIQVMLMLLGVLVVVIASSFFLKKKVEHFVDLPPDTQRLIDYKKLDRQLTNEDARRFNYVSDGMNDFLGGFLNPAHNN